MDKIHLSGIRVAPGLREGALDAMARLRRISVTRGGPRLIDTCHARWMGCLEKASLPRSFDS